jgi:signal transduction histidine kinase
MRLHQVGYLSIVFIFIFTVLFSLLVIHEEYKQFTATMIKQRENYMIKEHELMRTAAHQIEQIVKFASMRHEGSIDTDFVKLIAVFNQKEYQFIALYDPQMKLIEQSVVLSTLPFNALHVKPDAIFETHVVIDGKEEEVVLLSRTLIGNYHLILGHYLKPFHQLLRDQEYALKHRLIRLVLEVVTLSFILFAFIMAISSIFNSLVERDVNAFLDFFSHSKEGDHAINPEDAFFEEFKSMAGSANDMLHTIVIQKNELKELNRTLEERVQKKTLLLQELLDSQKQFIRHAIHETNTPLSVMITNIELYNMKHGRNNYLAKVEASVKQIFNIYDDLSFLVKKEQLSYPKRPIDLVSYLNSRIEFFDEVAQLATLSFDFENFCQSSCVIHFNETKLQRIVDNNLTNAIKYTKRDEVIHVTIENTNKDIIISFSSKSIPIKDTQKIFEAYYREDSFREGFGLGLNLVKSICDEEGIAILLTSTETTTRFQYRFRNS